MSSKQTGLIAGVSFLAGVVFFALSFGFLQKTPKNEYTISPAIVKADSEQIPSTPLGPNFVPIVKKVKPAVVQVLTEKRVVMQNNDLFSFFFNQPRGRQREDRQRGIGSGFFISSDGYILTNNHVVEDVTKIKVVTVSGKEYQAKRIGTDPRTDLALLKVDAKNCPYIELGDSSKVEVGEWVLAIGNPLQQAFTVTSGIISGEGRQLEGNADQLQDFLQTDAAINMGNSGGPLINMRGEAIGINSVILSPSGGNIGIGFAIPANMAKKVFNDLKTKGKVIRSYIGITMGFFNESDAKEQLDIAEAGCLIGKIEDDSPAQKAGLKKQDFIVAINGKKIENANQLQLAVANTKPGDTVEFTLLRGSKRQSIAIKVEEAPENLSLRANGVNRSAIDLGMVVIKNTPALARRYQLRTSEGLIVKQIDPNGVAEQNGLREGDVILSVGRTELTSVAEFEKIMSEKKPGSTVAMYINRAGQESPIRFEIPEE